jgi:hypothetical protein
VKQSFTSEAYVDQRWQLFGTPLNLNDCSEFSSNDIVDSAVLKVMGESFTQVEFYYKGDLLRFYKWGLISKEEHFSFPLYNAIHASFSSQMVAGPDGQLNPVFFVDTQEEAYRRAAEVYRLELANFEERHLVTQHSTDAIQYHCVGDGSTETYMTVLGINPFDKTTMIFFVIFGLILSAYGYTSRILR